MGAELIAVGCGTCGDVKAAHYVPDACFGCGARYYALAPVALFRLDLGEQSQKGLGLRLRPRVRVEFLGLWSTELRAKVEERFFDTTRRSERPAASAMRELEK